MCILKSSSRLMDSSIIFCTSGQKNYTLHMPCCCNSDDRRAWYHLGHQDIFSIIPSPRKIKLLIIYFCKLNFNHLSVYHEWLPALRLDILHQMLKPYHYHNLKLPRSVKHRPTDKHNSTIYDKKVA